MGDECGEFGGELVVVIGVELFFECGGFFGY